MQGSRPSWRLTFPESHTAVISRGGQQSAGDVPADAPHLRVMTVKLSHHLHLKLRGSCAAGALSPVKHTQDKSIFINQRSGVAMCLLRCSVFVAKLVSVTNWDMLPKWYEFENADVFGCDCQHVEGSSEIRSKGDVMNGVSYSHQRLRFGIFPVWLTETLFRNTHSCKS